jgi:hypothetical protein
MVTNRVHNRCDRYRSLTSTIPSSLVATDPTVTELSIKQLYPDFDGLNTFRDRRGWPYAWGLPGGGGQTVRDIAKVATETL